jgi:hypothetical protein
MWQYEWDCSVFFRYHRYQAERKTIIIILKVTYAFEDLQLLENIVVDLDSRTAKSIDQVKRVLWVRRDTSLHAVTLIIGVAWKSFQKL